MADWFRQTDWNDDIEAAFLARLKRARDKAQYLNIQAYTLLASHPMAAAQLCRQALTLNDPAQMARAGLYLGTALAASGDCDGAIAALEAAIEAERIDPMHRTAAYLDQALLVALTGRADMFDLVRGRLHEKHPLPFDDQVLTALISMALIGSGIGSGCDAENTRLARAALDILDATGPDQADLPGYLDVAAIKTQLTVIASPP